MVNIILYNSKENFFVQNHDFNKNIIILLGLGYNQSIESDILLLDISNNDEYIWTYTFDLSAPTPSPPPTPPPPSPTESSVTNNKSVMIGAIIGSFLGCTLLSFGGFFLHRRKNKDKDIQINPMAIYGF